MSRVSQRIVPLRCELHRFVIPWAPSSQRKEISQGQGPCNMLPEKVAFEREAFMFWSRPWAGGPFPLS